MRDLAIQIGPSVFATLAGAAQAIDIPPIDTVPLITAAQALTVTTNTANHRYIIATSDTLDAQGVSLFRVGMIILVAGFSNSGNNGRKKIKDLQISGTNTLLVVYDPTNLIVTETAPAAPVFSMLRLPNFCALLTNAAADTTARPWGLGMGTAPAATVNMLLPQSMQVVVQTSGCDQIILNGASGACCITSLVGN